MDATDENNNGRVTMALLGQQLEYIRDGQKELIKRFDDLARVTQDTEKKVGIYDTRLSTLEKETGTLRSRSDGFGIANAVAALIAGLVGWLK